MTSNMIVIVAIVVSILNIDGPTMSRIIQNIIYQIILRVCQTVWWDIIQTILRLIIRHNIYRAISISIFIHAYILSYFIFNSKIFGNRGILEKIVLDKNCMIRRRKKI